MHQEDTTRLSASIERQQTRSQIISPRERDVNPLTGEFDCLQQVKRLRRSVLRNAFKKKTYRVNPNAGAFHSHQDMEEELQGRQ